VYSVHTYTEAVAEFEYQELITRNSSKSRSGLASLAGIECENRDANIENRDVVIANRFSTRFSIHAGIENRVSTYF